MTMIRTVKLHITGQFNIGRIHSSWRWWWW